MIGGVQLQFAIFAALVSMGSATIDYVYIDESGQSGSEETRDCGQCPIVAQTTMVQSSESEQLQSEANRTQEMQRELRNELKRLLIKCNESAEVHCIEMGLKGGCSGLDPRQDSCQPKQPNTTYSGYDRAVECFQKNCVAATQLYSQHFTVSSDFYPPNKDNYFVAVGITPHDFNNNSIVERYEKGELKNDVIIMGVRRPVAGKSGSMDDQPFYGYLDNLRDNENLTLQGYRYENT